MNFYKISSHFSRKLSDRGTWNLVCKEYPYGLIYKKKFQVLRLHSIGEQCDANFKVSSHFSRKMCDWRTWNLVLHKVSKWVNIQKKFQVPRSHSIGEKCDTIFKLSSHFSRKLCDRGTWNLVCIEYLYGLIYKKNFKFLGLTVSEKNAMLTCKISKLFIMANVQLWIFTRYHCIFLKNCVTKEHEIWFV